LKALEKQEQAESERLTTLRDDLRELEGRQSLNESERQELETLLAATRTRVLFYEDSLEVLLCRTADILGRGTVETPDQAASVSAR
jgi:predicted  nucleic acid-binding Zn-ribbon protein